MACAAVKGELDPRRAAAPEAPSSGPATAQLGASPIWFGDHNSDAWCAAWINGQYVVADELELL